MQNILAGEQFALKKRKNKMSVVKHSVKRIILQHRLIKNCSSKELPKIDVVIVILTGCLLEAERQKTFGLT